MVHLWDVAKNAQASQRESYSHRKRTKAIVVEEINPITTEKKTKIELRILAAKDSCLSLVRPRQHGIANT